MEDYNSIEEFLEHVSLVTAIDENNEDNKVSIMTLHAAKVLNMIMFFYQDGKKGFFLTKKQLMKLAIKELKRRRLAYVGITRAKKNKISTSMVVDFKIIGCLHYNLDLLRS